MFKKNNNFIELCKLGKLSPDKIDDYVDMWHASDSDLDLFEFLGMTQQEYELWVADPKILKFIISARINDCTTEDCISEYHILMSRKNNKEDLGGRLTAPAC